MNNYLLDTTTIWRNHLFDIKIGGERCKPRGKAILELPQRTITIDMRRPVVKSKIRMLSYRFMAAEAYWILSGDDQVENIAPWNKNIAEFSDDGNTFYGAYGPKIIAQLPYVVLKLVKDPDSRQAGLTIWRESPPDTKDVPCTVAIFFRIKQGKLNAHVFMRSSDAWLGVPYDIFNFSMLAHKVCNSLRSHGVEVEPGILFLTMASAHIYEHNLEVVEKVVHTKLENDEMEQATTPEELFRGGNVQLMRYLKELRDTHKGDSLRWWEATK